MGWQDGGVQLTPSERDRILLFSVAELARARRARGLRLNVPEATALIADTVCESARDGRRHEEALAAGRAVLGPDDVLPGVADILVDVKVEAIFDDGTRLVVVPDPIGGGHQGDTAPGAIVVQRSSGAVDGRVGVHEDDVQHSSGAMDSRVGVHEDGVIHRDGHPAVGDVVRLEVRNTASVPITVTSHFHFFEVNPRLLFDRASAYGRHLHIAAGSSTYFPPGGVAEVELVPVKGSRVIIGFAGFVDGPLDAEGAKDIALQRLRACGFLDSSAPHADPDSAVDAVMALLDPRVQS